MPRYNYRCSDGCTILDWAKKCYSHMEFSDEEFSKFIEAKGYSSEDLGAPAIWEEQHGMFEEVDIKCIVCDGPSEKTMIGVDFQFYIRGNGYLDKDGCRRDMDLFKLNNDEDPYGYMRQPGEVEDLKDKLRKGGKFDPQRKYYS